MISEYSGRPAESGAASIACSKAVGDLRLGVLGDADPLLRAVVLAIVTSPGTALLGVWTSLPMLGGSTAILIAAELSTVRLSGLLLAVRVNRELAARCRGDTAEPADEE